MEKEDLKKFLIWLSDEPLFGIDTDDIDEIIEDYDAFNSSENPDSSLTASGHKIDRDGLL